MTYHAKALAADFKSIGLGVLSSQRLYCVVASLGSIDRLLEVESIKELSTIPRMGLVSARKVYKVMHQRNFIPNIRKLKDQGLLKTPVSNESLDKHETVVISMNELRDALIEIGPRGFLQAMNPHTSHGVERRHLFESESV